MPKVKPPADLIAAVARIADDATRRHYEKCIGIHANYIAADKCDPNWEYFLRTAKQERQVRKGKKNAAVK